MATRALRERLFPAVLAAAGVTLIGAGRLNYAAPTPRRTRRPALSPAPDTVADAVRPSMATRC